MKTKRFLFYCLAGLMVGCVPVVSLHPLFTKENIVFEEKLLGTWLEDANDPNSFWEFTRFNVAAAGELPEALKENAEKLYRLAVSDGEGHKGSFAACLVRLEDRLFLDIFADLFPSGEHDIEQMKLLYNAFLFVPAHTFVRVEFVGDRLKLRLTDDEDFKKLLEAEPNAVRFTEVDDRPVLTASTEELHAFVVKYADDERLFSNERTLMRKGK